MRVYTSADVIAVRIGTEDDNIVIKLRPLTYAQRKEVLGNIASQGGKVIEDRMGMIQNAVRYSVLSVSGLLTATGEEYQLEKAPDGFLSEKDIDDLLNIEGASDKLQLACVQLVAGGPFTKLNDPETGEELEGVTVLTGKNANGGF